MVSRSLLCSTVFFQSPSKVQVLILLFTFLQFYSAVSRDSKVHNSTNPSFFVVDFHTNVNCRLFTCMTTSLPKSLEFLVFWEILTVVSARPLISKYSSTFTMPLRIVWSVPIMTGITVTFMFHSFLVLWQDLSTNLFCRFLWFSFSGLRGRQSSLFSRFSFCFFFFTITKSGILAGLSDTFLYQNTREFKCLILQDGFWFVYVLFGCLVKFKLLAQFPVDHLSHPVVSCPILFFR